jgi:DNA-binding MarR family transcriptional regulator
MKTKSRSRAEMPDVDSDAFKLEDFLPYRLSVAANRVSRLFARRYSEAYGLSIPEWRVLAMVGRFGTLSPSAVGEWTAMDKVKVSRAAASLVARGLLKQTQDPRDGRGRLLRLTRKGAAVHQGVVPLACELEEQLAGGMSRTEWSGLLKALGKLSAHIRGFEGADYGASMD